MSAVYDNWDRLIRAVLRREDYLEIALRTPSDLSLASSLPSLSASTSFNFSSPSDYQVPLLDLSKLSYVGYSFTYDQILHATNNLSSSNLIKNGCSGDLYYGVLEGGIEVVAKEVDLCSAQKVSFLKSEIEFFAIVSHPRIVPLLGHCMENRNHKFLVYKYMPNKDLHTSFYNADCSLTPLEWKKRLKVATGVAQALSYLHHQCVPPLVHRNVKASSIMIDENYDGYIGSYTEVCTENKDRNLSRISKVLRLPKGSEQGAFDALNATCAYDVYSFGKILLQLVTGSLVFSNTNSRAPRLKEDILPYITTFDKELFLKIMDPCLSKEEHLVNEVWAVAVVAKACLSSNASKRPQIEMVLKSLKDYNLEEFSTVVSSTYTGQSTESATDGSESGMSQETASEISLDRWTALWNGQHSSPIGLDEAHQNDEIGASPNLMVFSFAELRDATKNFRSDCLLGEGEFGQVYKGQLPKRSASNSERLKKLLPSPLITIVKLDAHPTFPYTIFYRQTEVTMLGRLSHPNLIKLHGYCSEDTELLLVYEYMPKGSLSNHLFREGSSIQPLSWDKRLKVLIGAARGLEFLHASEREVVFRDFKSSSILLDRSYNAKLSDFGFAGKGPPENDTHVTTRIIGTYGYACPEYMTTGQLNVKSDVYGFGVVMVEVLTGLRAFDVTRAKGQQMLVDWIRPLLSDRRKIKTIMDTRLEGKYSRLAAVVVAQLALGCLSKLPNDRPSMKHVMETLEAIECFPEKEKIQAEEDRANPFAYLDHNIRAEVERAVHRGQLKLFFLLELQIATRNFSGKNIVGRGGFGKVYRGRLADGSLVAVKRLNEERTQGGELQFQTEVEVSTVVVHQNLRRLRGFCATPTERLLVYPFTVNGSVASCLRERSQTQPPLDWPTRKQIALDVARGLAHLHECDPIIIHRDVKAANIFLYEEFKAVVGDFGLAKFIANNNTDATIGDVVPTDNQDTEVTTAVRDAVGHAAPMYDEDPHVTTALRGTTGYIAPEYLRTGKVSVKTDVFGYGVTLLELLTGQRVFDLARLANDDDVMLLDWVQRILREKRLETLVDGDLQGIYDANEVEQLVQIALLCTQSSPSERPKMSDVLRMLEDDVVLAASWEEWEKEQMFRWSLTHYTTTDWLVADSTSFLRPYELSSGPR